LVWCRNRCHYPRLIAPVFHQNCSIIARRANGLYAAAVLYRTFDLWSQQQQLIIHHGRAGLLSFFCICRLAAPNLFRTIDPWHGSIVRKRSGGKCPAESMFPPFSVRKGNIGIFFAMAFDVGGIFAYRLFEYSNRDVL
jgi:hypothetical protein